MAEGPRHNHQGLGSKQEKLVLLLLLPTVW